MPPPRTLLSFDIGTRHLAYCALAHTPATGATTGETGETSGTPAKTVITHWQVVDLMEVEGTPYDESCAWVLSKSWKCPQLRAYLDAHGKSSVGARAVLLQRIHDDLKARGVAKVTGTNMCVLASKLYAYLDNQPWMLDCDTIVLENQPCLTNPVMKSVQMLLYGYFLYRAVWQKHQLNTAGGDGGDGGGHTLPLPLPRVMLTSASNKLKVCRAVLKADDNTTTVPDTPDTTTPDNATPTTTDADKAAEKKLQYKQRKKDAIALTGKVLAQWQAEDSVTPDERTALVAWHTKLRDSCVKEQDDLSDSFLQGLYVLYQHLAEASKKKAPKAPKVPKVPKASKASKVPKASKAPKAPKAPKASKASYT
jgi:hypothetical protein